MAKTAKKKKATKKTTAPKKRPEVKLNRGTGMLVIEVRHSNPNGDPDAESEPRTIDSDGRGLCLLYTSPSPRDATLSRMPSSA